jgi:acyl-CoA hydrolase
MRTARTLLDTLDEGASIYVQGAAGEARAFCDLVDADCGLRAPSFFSSLIPGLNSFDYTAKIPGARLRTLLVPAALRPAFDAGRATVWPVSYATAATLLSRDGAFDLAVAQARPPDVRGNCDLGVVADFLPLIWGTAKRRLLIINPEVPRLAGAATVRLADADAVLEGAGAPPAVVPPTLNSSSARVASSVAGLIRDRDTLQIGIGTIPDQVLGALCSHRDLRIHSGAVGDGLIALAEAGALCTGRIHRTGAVIGSSALYEFAAANDIMAMVDTLTTHAPHIFPAIPRFVSINTALEIDLFGQVNLEWRHGRLAGGIGGAPDFMLGARLSPDGCSIIALPATIGQGSGSRIVARLAGPTVSIGRHEADTIVTEYGVARIRGLSLDARAEALIELAAPEFRAPLCEAWREQRAKL